MKTYSILFFQLTENVVAETAGKAKYSYWKKINDCYDIEFKGFLKSAKCRFVNKFKYADLFTKNLGDFNETIQRRNIEFAHLGMRVEVCGKSGRIVGCNDSLNLDVCFDGEHWRTNCHPHHKIKYFDNNNSVIAEF